VAGLSIDEQAASKLVDAMVAGGYLARGDSAHDARQRPVSLTPTGQELLAVVEEIYRDLEAQWESAVGQADVERVRVVLTTMLAARHDGRLPPVRPLW
jgi:DNA-binding MarR family transcriptional regulator